MGKKRSFLGFLTYLFFAVFGANAFATSYSCDDAMFYVACNAGFYMVKNDETGNNTCVECTAGSYCTGGENAVAQKCPSASWSAAKASECTQCAPNSEIFGALVPSDYGYTEENDNGEYNGENGCLFVFDGVPVNNGTVSNIQCDVNGVCQYIGDSLDDLECSSGRLVNSVDELSDRINGVSIAELRNSEDLLCESVTTITCSAGTYLPAGATQCATCPAGYACAGDSFIPSDVDQGLTMCVDATYSSDGATTCSICEPLPTYVAGAELSNTSRDYTDVNACMTNCESQEEEVEICKQSCLHTDDSVCSISTTMTTTKGVLTGIYCRYSVEDNGYRCDASPEENLTCSASYEKTDEISTYDNATLSAIVEYMNNDCVLSSITCSAGEYLPAGATECATCLAGYACAGDSFIPSDVDQGLTMCVGNTYSTDGASQCVACGANSSSNSDKTACSCDEGYYDDGVGNCVVSVACTPGYQYNAETGSLEPCERGYFCSCDTDSASAEDTIKTKCDTSYPDTYVGMYTGETFERGAKTASECFVNNTKRCSCIRNDSLCPETARKCTFGTVNTFKNSVIYQGTTQCTTNPYSPEESYCPLVMIQCEGDSSLRQIGKYYDADEGQCLDCAFSGIYSNQTVEYIYSLNATADNERGATACFAVVNLPCTTPMCSAVGQIKGIASCEFDGDSYKERAGYLYYGSEVPRPGANTKSYLCPMTEWSCSANYSKNLILADIDYTGTVEDDEKDTADAYDLLTLTPANEWCLPNIYAIAFNDKGGNSNNSMMYEQYATGWFASEDTDEYGNQVVPEGSAIASVSVPTRVGYEFVGYKTTETVLQNPKNVIDANGNIVAEPNLFTSDATVYAWWNPIVYTITIDNNGGNGKYDTMYMQYASGWYTSYPQSGDTPITKLDLPTRDGYSFQGYKDANGNIVFDENGTPQSTTFTAANAKLTAQWSENTYKVVLHGYEPGNPNSAKDIYFRIDTGLCGDAACESKISTFANLGVAGDTAEYQLIGFLFGSENGTVAFDRDTNLTATEFKNKLFKNGNITDGTINLYASWNHNIIKCEAGKYYNGGNTLTACPPNHYCPNQYTEDDKKYAVIGGTDAQNACQAVACSDLAKDKFANMNFQSNGGVSATDPTACYVAVDAGKFIKLDEYENQYVIEQCPRGYVNGKATTKYFDYGHDFASVYNVACGACRAGMRANSTHTTCVACPEGPFEGGTYVDAAQYTFDAASDSDGGVVVSCPIEYTMIGSGVDDNGDNIGTIANVRCGLEDDDAETYICSAIDNLETDVKCASGYTLNGGLSDNFEEIVANEGNWMLDDGMFKIDADIVSGDKDLCRLNDAGYYSDGSGYTQKHCSEVWTMPSTRHEVSEWFAGNTCRHTYHDIDTDGLIIKDLECELVNDSETDEPVGYRCTTSIASCKAGWYNDKTILVMNESETSCDNGDAASQENGMMTCNGKNTHLVTIYEKDEVCYDDMDGYTVCPGTLISGIDDFVCDTETSQGHYAGKADGYAPHFIEFECAKGTYQSEYGAESCEKADAGYYVDATGASEQTACPAGAYQDNKGQSSCKACATGFYQPQIAQTLCLPAQPGYYVDNNDKTAQVMCPAGQYQLLSQQSSCETCAAANNADAANWQQVDGKTCQFVYDDATKIGVDNLGDISMTCTWTGTSYACSGTAKCAGQDEYEFRHDGNTIEQNGQYSVASDAYIKGWECYTMNFEIKYDLNGGTGVSNATCNKANGTVVFPLPSLKGHSFTGWKDVQNNNILESYGCEHNIALQAQWTVNSYTCSAGTYLPADAVECVPCRSGSFCNGGTFKYNKVVEQGISACVDASGYAAYDFGKLLGTSGVKVFVDKTASVSALNAKNAGECYVSVPDGSATHLVKNGSDYQIQVLPCRYGTAQTGGKVSFADLRVATPYNGNTFMCSACTGATYAYTNGMSACLTCPSYGPAGEAYASNLRDIIGGEVCTYIYDNVPLYDNSGRLNGVECIYRDYECGDPEFTDNPEQCFMENGYECAVNIVYDDAVNTLKCNPGYYNDNSECDEYDFSADKCIGGTVSGVNVSLYTEDLSTIGSGEEVCRPAESGYYSPADVLWRIECPGEYTVGSNTADSREDCAIYVPEGTYLAGQGDEQVNTCESGFYCPGDYTLNWGVDAWNSQSMRNFDIDNGFSGTIASDGSFGRFACRDDLEMTHSEEYQWVNDREFWTEEGADDLTDCHLDVAAGEYVWYDDEAGYVIESCPGSMYKPDSQTISVEDLGNNVYELPTPQCTPCADGYGDATTIGNTSANQCIATCPVVTLVSGGIAIPDASTVAYPATCTYTYGESVTGNPCEISCSANDVANDCFCVEKSCNPDYELINGRCVKCDREYALKYADSGNCVVTECVSGYHPDGQQCSSDIVECSAPNAVSAERRWNAAQGAFSECIITECESGYHVDGNACQLDIVTCELAHGIGEREWNHDINQWGPCVPTECDPGYTMDASQSNALTSANQCGECKNAYGQYGERVVSSYARECEIATCMYQGEIFALIGDRCELICQGEDETGRREWNKSTNKCDHYCADGYTRW